jgi:hypothetical protein
MQLRHISPRSIDWVDAMDEGGRGWEKLGPEERSKLRLGEYTAAWASEGTKSEEKSEEKSEDVSEDDDYGWEAVSASR